MLRLLVTGSIALTLTASLAVADPIVPGTGSYLRTTARLVRPGSERPWLVSGVLSTPSRATPVDIARGYLSGAEVVKGIDPASLRVDRQSKLPTGTSVKLLQTFQGLDVIGGTVFVRIDDQGRVRWVSSEVADIPAGFSTTPALTAGQAMAAVLAGPARHQKLTGVGTADHTKLVIWAPRRTPRLAWMVVLPANPVFLETLRVYLDARTGDVLSVDNLARTVDQAKVFPFNPVSTPDEQTVGLASLPDGSTTLTGVDIAANNCIDKGTCPMSIPGLGSIRWCVTEPKATADSSGDFMYDRPGDDTSPEDEFAEVQMYYHATKAYAAFRALGFGDLSARPLTAIVNVRIPDFSNATCGADGTGTGPLQPLDNAAFMPAGSIASFPPEDSIVFGQGTNVDFSYDGDVVYHEFTHAVQGTVTPLAPAYNDEAGLDTTGGGMIEGYADYFSCSITGDPAVGEYAGSGLDGVIGPIRSLDNSTHCPEDIDGEQHDDSEIWSAALWDIRAATAEADRPKLDQAIYVAMGSLGEAESYDSAQAKTVAEMQTTMGDTAAGAATAKFHARGVDGCNGRVIQVSDGYVKDRLMMYGTDAIQAPLVPGPVQWKLDLPVAANEIKVAIASAQAAGLGGFGGGGSPKLKLLVKSGDQAVVWSENATGLTHDAANSVDVIVTQGGAGSGSVTGDFPAGTYHVQLANAGPTFFLGDISFSYTEAPPPPVPDAGVVASQPDAGKPAATGDSSGCGCHAGGSSDANLGGGLLLLLALAFVRATRRRS